MSAKNIIQLGFFGVFVAWFIYTDHMERIFRRNEIFHMRDLVREIQSHHCNDGDETHSVVLTEALDAAGEDGKTGPGGLRVCLDARKKIDDAMRGALRGEGVLSASVELWSIHDDSIAEFCRQTIRDRKPFSQQNNEKRK